MSERCFMNLEVYILAGLRNHQWALGHCRRRLWVSITPLRHHNQCRCRTQNHWTSCIQHSWQQKHRLQEFHENESDFRSNNKKNGRHNGPGRVTCKTIPISSTKTYDSSVAGDRASCQLSEKWREGSVGLMVMFFEALTSWRTAEMERKSVKSEEGMNIIKN